jgi:serine/threonine-protein kinase RsbW
MRETTLSVACSFENLPIVGDAARDAAVELVGPEAGVHVEIAVTELCSNIIRHGHPTDPAHEFTMILRGGDRGLQVEIRDEGPPFAFHEKPMPAVDGGLDALPEGGFGIPLVRATMDRVELRREGSVNVFYLEKWGRA